MSSWDAKKIEENDLPEREPDCELCIKGWMEDRGESLKVKSSGRVEGRQDHIAYVLINFLVEHPVVAIAVVEGYMALLNEDEDEE